jgi:hypothetical protein
MVSGGLIHDETTYLDPAFHLSYICVSLWPNQSTSDETSANAKTVPDNHNTRG